MALTRPTMRPEVASLLDDIAGVTRAPIIELNIPYRRERSLDELIALWLAAKHARSSSDHTLRNYSDQIRWFREWLQERELDLDHPDVVRLAKEAHAWAIREHPVRNPRTRTPSGWKPPARSTYNHRLATISSFYTYVRKHRLLAVDNPIDFTDRAVVPTYPDPKALDVAEVAQQLGAIDRTTLRGKRDLALLTIGLITGRRKAELLQLRMGDIEFSGEQLTLIWRRCKGGKVMRDTLSAIPRRILLDYLRTLYGADLKQVAPDAAVWASVAPWNKGKPIAETAVFRICLRNLGITSVHRLRHTFAHAMEAAGATVSDIQSRLGHANLATTHTYLTALRREENPVGDTLAELFGLVDLASDVEVPVIVPPCGWCRQALDIFAQSDPNRRYCSQACLKAAERAKRQQRRKHSPENESPVLECSILESSTKPSTIAAPIQQLSL